MRSRLQKMNPDTSRSDVFWSRRRGIKENNYA